MQKPALVFQPTTHQKFQIGVKTVVDAIRPTLGPMPRTVALQSIVQHKGIELLDNGGLIARRLIQFPDRSVDVGAMFLRHILWDIYERTGDGTATAAVIFESVFASGLRFLAAGGNAMLFANALEATLVDTLNAFDAQVRPVADSDELVELAYSLCYDRLLAETLCEAFDLIGNHGNLEIRTGQGRHIHSEYVVGSYWPAAILSPKFINRIDTMRGELTEPAILLTDFEFKTPQELLPVLRLAKTHQIRKLVLVARQLSDPVIGVLKAAGNDPSVFQSIAVSVPGKADYDQMIHLNDLSVCTGARVFYSAAGETLEGLRLSDLGHARKVWADKNYLTVVGFGGHPKQLRQHMDSLKALIESAEDFERRDRFHRRLARLLGGSAVLHIGAATESELKSIESLTKRTVRSVREAVRDGVVPGGGVAFLRIQDSLREKSVSSPSSEERAAYRAVIKALEVPLRTILANAGYDAGDVLARLRLVSPHAGFDVQTGLIGTTEELGIWDASGVLRTALIKSLKGVALALTTDVIVHHKNPEESQEP